MSSKIERSLSEFKLNPVGKLPITKALLVGPKASVQIRVLVATGSTTTQVNQSILTYTGLDLSLKCGDFEINRGPGQKDQGALFKLEKLYALGAKFEQPTVVGYDMSWLTEVGIDGLLGFDLIRQMHFELDGPKGILRAIRSSQVA